MTTAGQTEPPQPILADLSRLSGFCIEVLRAVGADCATADATSRSLLHGTLHGIDSHGVRLLPHYAKVLRGGRLNPQPNMRFTQIRPASGLLDADHAQGALATYTAVEQACAMARKSGIAAVGIRNSSHFGPAGAYALAGVNEGMLCLVAGNSDSFVRLHDGMSRFHGTNPIALAVPTGVQNPWLVDMATSAIPYNRIGLFESLGQNLPAAAASNALGEDTVKPGEAAMLAPLGGAFGFKGAGLAGMAEILSAALTGMRFSPDILPMGGADIKTPREMGAFVLAIDPDGFAGAAVLHAGMQHYLSLLRNSPAKPGGRVLAPGDREWTVAAERSRTGVPLDPATVAAFEALAKELGVAMPFEP